MLSLLLVLLSSKIWHSRNLPPKGHVFKNELMAPFKSTQNIGYESGKQARLALPYPSSLTALPSPHVSPQLQNIQSHLGLLWHYFVIFINFGQSIKDLESSDTDLNLTPSLSGNVILEETK